MSNKKTILSEASLEYNEILKAAKELAINEGIGKVNKLINENLSNDIKSKEPIQESFQNDNEEESISFDVKSGENEEPNSSEDNQNIFTEALDDESNDEEINLSELPFEELEEMFNEADEEDEFNIDDKVIDNISIDDLESELNSTEIPTENGEQLPDEEENEVEIEGNETNDQLELSTVEVLSKLQGELGNLILSLQDKDDQDKLSTEFDGHMQNIYGEGYREKLGENYDELFTIYKQNKSNNMDKGKEVSENIENLNLDDDQNKEPQEEEQVDESHGSQLSLNKRAGADVQPRPEYAQYKENKLRAGIQEGVDKRIETLINENKKLKKQLSEINEGTNKLSKTVDEKNNLLEKYTNVLENYRTRLNEMVVFNTNLANVNNLLVNEDLTLNSKDKERIIESFKTVSTIEESKNKYGELLVEMKSSTSSNIQNIAKKVDTSIESSSKQLVNEMVEQTSFSPEIKKMMDRINYTHKK